MISVFDLRALVVSHNTACKEHHHGGRAALRSDVVNGVVRRFVRVAAGVASVSSWFNEHLQPQQQR